MEINNYLEKYQPVVYKTFLNAFEKDKLSHAYLLCGSVGMPLKQSALFLAKSLICDNQNPLACNTCITCARVDEGNYPDLMIFDGESGKIKKGDVEKITDNFDKTALEEKGVMIYILHLVETMTPVAVNALLKFLEEPGRNVYAFLTTENESKVLPTIISRTQVLRFREINRDLIIEDSISSGVSNKDAEILSGFYNDSETIKIVSESEDYKLALDCVITQLESLKDGFAKAIYVNQKEIIPVIKTQTVAHLYINILCEFFKDLLNKKVNAPIILKSYDNILSEVYPLLNNIDKTLLTIMAANKKLDYNVNIALTLEHITYEITKEGK